MKLPVVHSGVVDVIISALRLGGYVTDDYSVDQIRKAPAQMDEAAREAWASTLHYTGAPPTTSETLALPLIPGWGDLFPTVGDGWMWPHTDTNPHWRCLPGTACKDLYIPLPALAVGRIVTEVSGVIASNQALSGDNDQGIIGLYRCDPTTQMVHQAYSTTDPPWYAGGGAGAQVAWTTGPFQRFIESGFQYYVRFRSGYNIFPQRYYEVLSLQVTVTA